ncbi:MAG: TolC family protein [Candidatus Omnitrophica bacterium]|nr:TolC family protein [Candidatus Omnitrophota bacterium]MBU0895265.1 TolC family protein [Candidatus Omnitrophota bacterium]MBU1808191.1 TolC family protein [Candidatus Omnitrophota bacterium]
MTKKILIVSMLLLPAAFSGLYRARCNEVIRPADVRVFTLKDSINTAILNNRPIQEQEQQVDYARAGILYARSAFLPQVGVSYSYTLNDAVPGLGPVRPGARKDPAVYYDYKNSNLITLSAKETIYNGGADIASLKQSKLGLKVEGETLRAAKLDVEFETKRLFYGLLLAYETLRIAQDLVAQASAHYEHTSAMFNQGTASKFDVLQSKVQVSKLMPQLINAQNAIDLIMADFKKLLVIRMSETIAIDGKLDYKLIEIKEDEFLREAYSRNPQMILKLLGVDINRWAIEYAKAGWLPQISAGANYTFQSDDISVLVLPRQSLWNVGVQATIAIFDGFATKAKVDQAKAQYNRARLAKEDVSDQVAVDIKQACLNLKESKTVIDSQKDSIVEAVEALRLANVRFDNGVGINLDVIDAQTSLAQVQQNLAQGIYDYIMAKAQVNKVMGRQYSGGGNYGAGY